MSVSRISVPWRAKMHSMSEMRSASARSLHNWGSDVSRNCCQIAAFHSCWLASRCCPPPALRDDAAAAALSRLLFRSDALLLSAPETPVQLFFAAIMASSLILAAPTARPPCFPRPLSDARSIVLPTESPFKTLRSSLNCSKVASRASASVIVRRPRFRSYAFGADAVCRISAMSSSSARVSSQEPIAHRRAFCATKPGTWLASLRARPTIRRGCSFNSPWMERSTAISI
mmetsp:Transcript_27398/g.69097  ORF Transcript_27398/g.69097 Transcript_27398/m.69097 type:complete len:230 (-) Transcript_27398:1702-2391(-)